jgi:GT2 family glycosyltransferase
MNHLVIDFFGEFNFSLINNFAVNNLAKDFTHFLFCNNDIEAIHPEWLEKMLGFFQFNDVAIVGANLIYPNNNLIQHAGVCVGLHGAADHYGKLLNNSSRIDDSPNYYLLKNSREVSAVTAACLLIKKSVFNEVQGFNEELKVGFGDIDLCLKVYEKKYRIIQCAKAILVHHESFSRKKEPHSQDTIIFKEKWKKFILQGDPFFNPNFNPSMTNWLPLLPIRFRKYYRKRLINREN